MKAEDYRKRLIELQQALINFELDPEITDYRENSLEDSFLLKASKAIEKEVGSLIDSIEHARKPNEEKGTIEQRGERYYLNDIQLKEGTVIEAELTHPETGETYLYCTEIEKCLCSYYMKVFEDIPLKGLKARILW